MELIVIFIGPEKDICRIRRNNKKRHNDDENWDRKDQHFEDLYPYLADWANKEKN